MTLIRLWGKRMPGFRQTLLRQVRTEGVSERKGRCEKSLLGKKALVLRRRKHTCEVLRNTECVYANPFGCTDRQAGK